MSTVKTIETTQDINLASELEFRQLFSDYYVPLCVFADKYVEDGELASDIVQECFIKLWQIRRDFLYLHQVKSFLYTSIRNQALNAIEHSKVVKEYAQNIQAKSSMHFFTEQVIEDEVYHLLTEAIGKLPKQMNAIMTLALEGKPNAEIAENLHISIETVRTLRKLAYRKLRILLKEYYYILFLFI